MRGMRDIRAIARSSLVLLGVSLVVGLGAGTSLAFPTGGTDITSVNVLSGAKTEQIHVGGSLDPTPVYMGPYKITGSTFVEYMMCFNAAATALPTTYALATDTAGAITLFGPSYADKINMIAWLASQWDVSGSLATEKNANINKAMWEIWADYGSTTTLSVDGASDNKGSFFLNIGDGDIKAVQDFVDLAQEHNSDGAPANFLIPLTARDGVYDISKQPFVAPVPEPGTLLLLGSGLTVLGLFGWRKRARAKR